MRGGGLLLLYQAEERAAPGWRRGELQGGGEESSRVEDSSRVEERRAPSTEPSENRTGTVMERRCQTNVYKWHLRSVRKVCVSGHVVWVQIRVCGFILFLFTYFTFF